MTRQHESHRTMHAQIYTYMYSIHTEMCCERARFAITTVNSSTSNLTHFKLTAKIASIFGGLADHFKKSPFLTKKSHAVSLALIRHIIIDVIIIIFRSACLNFTITSGIVTRIFGCIWTNRCIICPQIYHWKQSVYFGSLLRFSL